uniref:Uncharacterized protein n=1 Tax=Aliivibrio fischeri TaxID=668 RepID=H2ERS0_ALIFS|nr:hypothetical protein [Aliivibrio fischeri]AEY78087.1 hypothetical protein [Aliivibrio fischeri]
MKLTFNNPIKNNRTSITINDNMIRLWGTINNYETESDDFMYDAQFKTNINQLICDLAISYAKSISNFPTFVSYVENYMIVEAESTIKKLKIS